MIKKFEEFLESKESFFDPMLKKLKEISEKPNLIKYGLDKPDWNINDIMDVVFKNYNKENPIPANELSDLIEFLTLSCLNSHKSVENIMKFYVTALKHCGLNISLFNDDEYSKLTSKLMSDYMSIDFKKMFDECDGNNPIIVEK